MRRGQTGHYERVSTLDEQFSSFIPNPLPPDPPLLLDGEIIELLTEAMLALGRLDAASVQLPDQSLLVYSYVRKEAVLSSQIEGTQSSLSELLQYELGNAPLGLTDDVVEVSNYVAALEHGLDRLHDDFPLSNRLIRQIHEILLSRGRGSGKMPGEFRRSQMWIGGSRPSNATFVPPPHTHVQESMGSLERFLHASDDRSPILIKTGLAHLQFETIHPFLDGNGRVGRLLITLMLCHAGILRLPVLYLSLYLKRHRTTYYELLDDVRASGDWERWLAFFLEGVRDTAVNAYATSERLTNLFETHRNRIEEMANRRSSVSRVHEVLKSRPVTTIAELSRLAEVTYPTASSAITALADLDIAREITGRQTNRVFVYDEYLSILSEGTEL